MYLWRAWEPSLSRLYGQPAARESIVCWCTVKSQSTSDVCMCAWARLLFVWACVHVCVRECVRVQLSGWYGWASHLQLSSGNPSALQRGGCNYE